MHIKDITAAVNKLLGEGEDRLTLSEALGAPVTLEEDAEGIVRLHIAIDDMSIHDLTLSSCGRFTIDPLETYGMDADKVQLFQDLSQLLEDAVQAALNAACLTIQTAFGDRSGDLAGIHFSGDSEQNTLRRIFGEYLLEEVNSGD